MKPRRWVFPVSADRLAWCKKQISHFERAGNFHVSTLAETREFQSHLRLLRMNHLTGKQAISGNMFREAADRIISEMVRHYIHKAIPHTPIGLFPWRAGLAFLYSFASNVPSGRAAREHLYHLGASRDEKTLQTKIYFEEPAPLLVENKFDRHELVHCYVVDPMLATGNTTITAIEHLRKYRVREKPITDDMITVMSLFAAPEGVTRLLDKYRNLRILCMALDDRLNEHGFIVPGVGDFGDQYFAGLTAENFKVFRIYEWMSPPVWSAFAERLKAR